MIKVEFMDLPNTVKGMTVRSFEDGENFYTIFINSRLSKPTQESAYRHELWHITHDDFERGNLWLSEKLARESTNS